MKFTSILFLATSATALTNYDMYLQRRALEAELDHHLLQVRAIEAELDDHYMLWARGGTGRPSPPGSDRSSLPPSSRQQNSQQNTVPSGNRRVGPPGSDRSSLPPSARDQSHQRNNSPSENRRNGPPGSNGSGIPPRD